MDKSSTYIYPSNCDAEGRDIAIAFDEQELDSLVKILKKEDGPIAKNLLQIFRIEQDDWTCYSFHGRFICDKCGQEHNGVMVPKQIREFLTKLLRDKYPDCLTIECKCLPDHARIFTEGEISQYCWYFSLIRDKDDFHEFLCPKTILNELRGARTFLERIREGKDKNRLRSNKQRNNIHDSSITVLRQYRVLMF
ncbi:MAG: hypothetical protein WA364_07490 [Candidatus Nitrosopolaris sp.]